MQDIKYHSESSLDSDLDDNDSFLNTDDELSDIESEVESVKVQDTCQILNDIPMMLYESFF